jgi:hypothetical protein
LNGIVTLAPRRPIERRPRAASRSRDSIGT